MGELSNFARENAERYRDTRAEEAAKKEAEHALALQRVNEFVTLMNEHGVQPHALCEYSGESRVPFKNSLRFALTPSIMMSVDRMKELKRTHPRYRVVAMGWDIIDVQGYMDDSSEHGVFVTVDGELIGTDYHSDYETNPRKITEVRYGASQESMLNMLARNDALDKMAASLARYGVLKSLE